MEGAQRRELLKNGESETLDMATPASDTLPAAISLGTSWNRAGVPQSPSSWKASPLHRTAFEANQAGPPSGMFYPEGRGARMSFCSAAPAPPKSDLLSLEFQVQIDRSMGVQEVTFEGSEQGRGLGRLWYL